MFHFQFQISKKVLKGVNITILKRVLRIKNLKFMWESISLVFTNEAYDFFEFFLNISLVVNISFPPVPQSNKVVFQASPICFTAPSNHHGPEKR